MDEKKRIPMPAPRERQASIRRTAARALARPPLVCPPLAALFFGVEDCLFLAVVLALLPAALCFVPAEALARQLAVLLFLTSPLLYAAAQALTLWKESLCGTLEWKRTCRIPLRVLLALRMLFSGGMAVLVCVPMNLLLWHASGHAAPLLRMLGLSFSSLFLYAALSLLCRRLTFLLPPVLWALLGLLLQRGDWGAALLEVPTAVFFLLAGLGLAVSLSQLWRMLQNPIKGGFRYAFR